MELVGEVYLPHIFSENTSGELHHFRLFLKHIQHVLAQIQSSNLVSLLHERNVMPPRPTADIQNLAHWSFSKAVEDEPEEF